MDNKPDALAEPPACADREPPPPAVAGWSLGTKLPWGAVALVLAATFVLLAISVGKQADTTRALAVPEPGIE